MSELAEAIVMSTKQVIGKTIYGVTHNGTTNWFYNEVEANEFAKGLL